MESLPKPLVVLIGSIIEEYEHFTWNSTYLGDKMRISLVWTRGELINRNNGKKHKSPSKIERDNRRSDTWHEKQESNRLICLLLIDTLTGSTSTGRVFTCTGVTLGEITSVFSICSSSDSVSIFHAMYPNVYCLSLFLMVICVSFHCFYLSVRLLSKLM
jgi:hypothetical protein